MTKKTKQKAARDAAFCFLAGGEGSESCSKDVGGRV
jgi:hypothetical protein